MIPAYAIISRRFFLAKRVWVEADVARRDKETSESCGRSVRRRQCLSDYDPRRRIPVAASGPSTSDGGTEEFS
jgi:hypothetical protein